MNNKAADKKRILWTARALLGILFCALILSAQAAFATDESENVQPLSGIVIGIDPCNQKTENSETEPLYPNSDRRVWKMAKGAVGVKSNTPEYELNLAIALKLEQRLRDAGAEVIMTREDNDVDISNAGRAEFMNSYNVDFWIRISCKTSPDISVSGALITFPSRAYAEGIYARSLDLARKVSDELQKLMGANKTVIIQALPNRAAFNYSKAPVIDVGVGYLSNPKDDLDLNREMYLSSIATSISDGVKHMFSGGQ